jgi:hypothetical protein
MSYFEHYYNPAGDKTLRAYSRPVNLTGFDRGIRWSETFEEVWAIPEYLCEIPHTSILTRAMERRLSRMDQRLYDAGRLGGVCKPLLNLKRVALTSAFATRRASRPPRRSR